MCEGLERITAHAAVNDFGNRQSGEMLIGINFRIERGQEREWAWNGDALGFVLNVIDDDAVDGQRFESSQLVLDDDF